MTRKQSALLEKPVAKQTCRHHWLIEPVSGLSSKGVCKYCGEKKQFLNIIQEELPQLKHKNKSSEISLEKLVDDDEDSSKHSESELDTEI